MKILTISLTQYNARKVEPDSHLIIPGVAKPNIDLGEGKKKRTIILPCRRVGHADNGKYALHIQVIRKFLMRRMKNI